MASTYSLIKGETLSASAASYTFTSIPATFTDLCLKMSLRDTQTGGVYTSSVSVKFNADSANNYSYITMYYSVPSAGGFVSTTNNQTSQLLYHASDAGDATTSTFANSEIYIPSYTANQNKPFSGSFAPEQNDTSNGRMLGTEAGLWRNTAAITTIALTPSGGSFAAQSSFYLYGISKS